MRAGVLGAGFGLYGYLPAMAAAGATRIALPVRYQAAFAKRTELAQFAGLIEWGDEAHIPGMVDMLGIARRPDQQEAAVRTALTSSKAQYLLLEKPMAADPAAALALCNALEASGRAWRIGYVFRFTPWGERLRAATGGLQGSVLLRWGFHAHHFRHGLANWKRSQAAGGGVLRFYGIHVIALLAEMGYETVAASRVFGRNADEPERWEAEFRGTGLPGFFVTIDSRADKAAFLLESREAASSPSATLSPSGEGLIVSLADPFAEIKADDGLDGRVRLLTPLVQSLTSEAICCYPWYRSAINLWARAEAASEFITL